MGRRYFKKNSWWVSPFNEAAEVQKQSEPAQKVELHDLTLRDFGKHYGARYTQLDMERIAEKLMEVGVERIEVGISVDDPSLNEAARKICKAEGASTIYAGVRAIQSDIDIAGEIGVGGVVIGVPIGYPALKYQYGWTWENALEKSAEAVAHAKARNLRAVLSLSDVARARPDDLDKFLRGLTKGAQPDAVCLEDAAGCALPATIQHLVKRVGRVTKGLLPMDKGLPVEVHTCNDFGLAVAGALSGFSAGAVAAYTCVNGLGARAGVAPLEELIVNMKVLLGLSNDYKLERLLDLCLLVEELADIPIPANKPFGGYRTYMLETDDTPASKHPLITFSTDPQLFGRKLQVIPKKK